VLLTQTDAGLMPLCEVEPDDERCMDEDGGV
jgi:hypothetical protein